MSWAAQQPRPLLAAVEGALAADVVVGVVAVDQDGPVICASPRCHADARFEIGSVTKTMTATLLASLVGEGSVALRDPVGCWFDAGRNADVTVAELATHTSGLPRLAPTHRPGGPNPYQRFTAQLAEEGLRQAERSGRGQFAYSNFGYQLLGVVLERATGQSYSDLLSERLLGPLGMSGSGIGPLDVGRRLSGHCDGCAVEHWDFALPGPGGVEVTIDDLGRYLDACLRPPPGPLGAAIRMPQQPHARVGTHEQIGLAWLIIQERILRHSGATGGFSTAVALDRKQRRALGLLVNTGRTAAAVLQQAALLAVHGVDVGQLNRVDGAWLGPRRAVLRGRTQ